MRYHCLQHVSFETPGLIANWIAEQGYSLSFTGLFQNDPLPAVHEFDALVIMGGPMSIHDETEFPWLKKEKELIAAALRDNKKVLGICLGAQLIATVAGARVYNNPQKEIGFWPLHWTDAVRNWLESAGGDGKSGSEEGWPAESHLFHWHGETFDLPAGSIHLAFTAACPNQGFLLGETALGLQFHPELTPTMVREMINHERHELAPAPFVQSEAAILDQLVSLKGNEKILYPLLDRFFHGLRPE